MIKAILSEGLTEDTVETEYPNRVTVNHKNPFFTPDLLRVTGSMKGLNRSEVNDWIEKLMRDFDIAPENTKVILEDVGITVQVDKEKTTNPIMKFFETEHLPEELQPISGRVGILAAKMDQQLPDCAEKSAGLRKLLEAKDCFVRAYLEKK